MSHSSKSSLKLSLFGSFLCICMLTSVAKAATPNFGDWSGDFRFRAERVTNTTKADLLRERIRVRLVSKWEVNPQTSFKLGLATGALDARSSNQTLGNTTSAFGGYTPYINLAELSYKAASDLTVTVGKVKNPLFTVSELVWDADVNPDGVAFQYGNAPKEGFGLFTTGGIFSLDEWLKNTGVTGAKLFAIQQGFTYSQGDYSAKAALAYNVFTDVDGKSLGNGNATLASGKNNTLTGGKLKYGYQPLVLAASSSLKGFFGLPVATVYTEDVLNPSVQDTFRNQAYLVGVKFGTAKVKESGDWQVDANYRYLQTDAVLDLFTESDFYSGMTGVKGLKLGFNYGLASNTSFGLSTYFTEVLDTVAGTAGATEAIVQADLKFDF